MLLWGGRNTYFVNRNSAFWGVTWHYNQKNTTFVLFCGHLNTHNCVCMTS